ncbi:MAG TPA: aroma-sacti cluster domain-containing protein [Pyrinomonadaceae bacterium]|jgi:2-hydroxy-3-keto-5-methylthiopentenyl-1-phosphate phosphatase
MTNQEQLIDAEILKKDIRLSPKQKEAIEKLTPEEVEVIISVKKKVANSLPVESLIAPISHHH